MIQRTGSTLPFALALALLAAPTGAGAQPKDSGPGIQDVQGEAYNGPKARIAVKDFEDKMSSTGHYRAEYGRGMRDMLTTALFETNRYIVLEREKLQGVVEELRQGTSDLFRKEATVPLGELEGAELLITAAITGFDPGTSGGGGSLGGLVPGRLGGVLGGVGGGYKKATVAMDLRVIDVRTGRVVAATAAHGEATSFAAGLGGIGGGMGGSLGGFAKTPMESAIRDMIKKSVDFVVGKTPAVYYRFGGTTVASPPGGAPPGAPPAVAALAPPPPAAAPSGPKALALIRSDADQNLVARLTDATVRGAVFTVVVTLTLEGGKAQSEKIELVAGKSLVLDYATGQTYAVINADGFTSGQLKAGEVKTLRVTFKAPKDAKTVGITLSGVGTFDDVKLGP